MRNAHGVEPTRYMKREESEYAIECDPRCGPLFGFFDICLDYQINEENSCYIHNDGINSYECHPEYKSSLFVNTDEPDEENKFILLDYEVYTHN